MKPRFSRAVLLSAIMLVFTVSMCWSQDEANTEANNKDQSDIAKRIEASARVLDEVMAIKDKAIPDKVMSGAKCIAVIPSYVRIAIGFGGSHGKGVATCRTANGWSAPAPITLTGGSFGFQFGGEAVDLVLVVMDKHGMDQLLASKFKIGGSVSGAAGPVGRDATADTNWKFNAEILSYSRARGVFAGVDLSGTAITQDKDETRLLYGKMLPFTEILSGKVAPPRAAHPLLAAVNKYYEQAKGEKPAHTGE